MKAFPSTDPCSAPLLPGARLGVLGGGQLGRMFAMAAARLGYRVHIFSPEADAPAADVCHVETNAPFGDLQALRRFAQDVDVVTLEFENIPFDAVEIVARHAPLRPSGKTLWLTQQRLREKNFLRECGIPCTRFAEATTDDQLANALREVGLPAVLKTTAWGYDGKGQSLVRTPDDAAKAHRALAGAGAILEAWVDFQCELSVLVARSQRGEIAVCGPIVNEHDRHILDVSTLSNADVQEFAPNAQATAIAVAEALEAVGLLCVEFFLTRDGQLLVNEIAPRPHNSGHLTIDACATSQFEQQVRAVCGVPLGSFELLAPAAAMANLLGDLWQRGVPRWEVVLANPRLRLHLYGKADARIGRKMGHLTALADSAVEARRLVLEARKSLAPSS